MKKYAVRVETMLTVENLVHVNAETEDDAIDKAIDYAKKQPVPKMKNLIGVQHITGTTFKI